MDNPERVDKHILTPLLLTKNDSLEVDGAVTADDKAPFVQLGKGDILLEVSI